MIDTFCRNCTDFLRFTHSVEIAVSNRESVAVTCVAPYAVTPNACGAIRFIKCVWNALVPSVLCKKRICINLDFHADEVKTVETAYFIATGLYFSGRCWRGDGGRNGRWYGRQSREQEAIVASAWTNTVHCFPYGRLEMCCCSRGNLFVLLRYILDFVMGRVIWFCQGRGRSGAAVRPGSAAVYELLVMLIGRYTCTLVCRLHKLNRAKCRSKHRRTRRPFGRLVTISVRWSLFSSRSLSVEDFIYLFANVYTFWCLGSRFKYFVGSKMAAIWP